MDKKNIIFLLLIVLFLVIPQREVHAVKFYGISEQYGYNKDNGNTFVGITGGDVRCTPSNVACNPIKKKRGTDDIAYCANRNLSLTSKEYYLDKTWSNAKTCVYKVNNVKYSDGDCSSIMGYIIKKANEKKKGKSTAAKYAFTQVVLWTYLGKFTPSKYSSNNSNSDKYWNSHKAIREVIQAGWDGYVKARDDGLITTNTTGGSVNFDVSVDNDSFYYEPSGTASCGRNLGSYKTKSITITNTDSNAPQITLNISAIVDNSNGTSDTVRICSDKTGCSDSTVSVTLLKNQSVSYYLKALSNASFSHVTLSVSSSYKTEETVQSTEKVYDSERYTIEKNGQNGGRQSMIILKSSPANIVNNVEYSSEKNIVFNKPSMEHYTCSNSSNASSSNNSSQTSPTKKVCKSNAVNQANEDEYKYRFNGCNCTTISLGNGSSVNLILNENLQFVYDELSPTKIYAGRSFEITNLVYKSKISWEYADRLGGVPYYYNSSNPFDYDATSIENQIIQQLRNKFENKAIDVHFVSRDSNTYSTDMEEFSVKLPLDSNYDNENNLFEISSQKFQLPAAYLSNDAKVKYGNMDDYYIHFGGNKRYVPLNYTEDKYPLNIGSNNKGVNLSLVGGNAYVYYQCDEDIDYSGGGDTPSTSSIFGVTYRSIDVKAPFKKNASGEIVAENWKRWWSVESNKNRMKNSYQNYPSNPLYEIDINSEVLNKIKTSNLVNPYSSWSLINANGSSRFVQDNFSRYAVSGVSYCEIGKFSSSCDR